jgi:hypothetical protein
VALCEAMDLDPDRVTHIRISIGPRELAEVTAVMLVDANDGRVANLLKFYRLTWAPPLAEDRIA